MTSPHSLPDYKEQYFEYKELSKVYGKPTLDKIIPTWRQLKRNAQRIPTALGGGNHGYLSLLLTPNDHYNILGTASLIIPTHPGIFTPISTRGQALGCIRSR